MGAESWERNKLRNTHLPDHGIGVRSRSVSGPTVWINRRSVEDASGKTQETASGPMRVHRISRLPAWVKTGRQTTGGHLAELARAHDAVLATLDERIPSGFVIPG